MSLQRWVGFAFLLSACGGGAGSGDAPDAPGGAAAGGNGATAGAGATSGGAAGMPDTAPAPFTAATKLWIGAPDDAATTVIYAFSTSVPCSLISAHGWDAKVPNDTQLVELKAFGQAAGTYTVVTTKTPAPGEASVNYTFSTAANATETSASDGTVTLSALNANRNVTGSYSLQFGTTLLDGAFDAVYCAGGVEP
ncbi:MAG: hypothetical protein ABI627_07625 [Polyangiaceae bacterium]